MVHLIIDAIFFLLSLLDMHNVLLGRYLGYQFIKHSVLNLSAWLGLGKQKSLYNDIFAINKYGTEVVMVMLLK